MLSGSRLKLNPRYIIDLRRSIRDLEAETKPDSNNLI